MIYKANVSRPEKRLHGIASMERKWGIIFATPIMIGFTIFILGPMIASLYFSLTNWEIGSPAEFIGLSNYKKMFTEDTAFRKSLVVSLYYAVLGTPVTVLFGFLAALLMNNKIRFLSLFRTIFYLPSVVPGIAVIIIWMYLYNPEFGIFNSILDFLGIPGLEWVYSEATAVPSIVLMVAWQSSGALMIIFLAGLQGTPAHLYEAIEVDGGKSWHKFWYITLPSLTPTIFYCLITQLIATIQVFDVAYAMTQGGPNNATRFFVYNIYTTAFSQSKMGYASALAWILFVIIALLTFVVFKTSKSWVYYEGGDKH
ncbi:carbohydrate ABC transporter permease [Paenibacillus nasutitermitis]|nr:sugar ABC transporter permease [Paenibacillus nasutitermitis]